MIIRALDKDGDWEFGNGKSSYKKGLDALKQNLKTRLLEWKGDCFFDNEAGIDWRNRIGDRVSNNNLLQDEIRSVILRTDNIINVTDLDLDFNSIDRKLTINYSIQTSFSQEELNDNILI